MRYFLCVLLALVLVSCGADGEVEVNAKGSVAISGITVNYTAATVTLKTIDVEEYGYIIEPASAKGQYTSEQIFAEGKTGNSKGKDKVTFTINDLTQNTKYRIHAAGRTAGRYVESIFFDFTTKKMPEVSVISKTYDGFTAAYTYPSSIAAGSVVKYALVDVVQYNMAGGDTSADEWLNRNEQIYANYVTADERFVFSTANNTITHNGSTYYRHDPVTAGQPSYLLLGEYGAGTHAEYGEGHYKALYTASSGYFRKELVISKAPATLASKPDIALRLAASGGKIVVTPTSDITKFYYAIISEAEYNNLTSKLFGGEFSYRQWFVTSTAAERHYGAKSASGETAIDLAPYKLQSGTKYYIMITSLGKSDGSSQSYLEQTFTLPAAAPEAADNIIVAHRGGSTEAGKTATPDNSIASLRYAQRLRCYASEADIYWTKDNRIIVAHADGNIKINGLYPWEHTLAELQASGKLSNGETMASLEEYLLETMKSGSCTKLWLDIKNCYVSSSAPHHDKVVKATERACEIITEMGAAPWVEFICTGYEDPMPASKAAAEKAGVPFGWMANKYAATYVNKGVKWANLSVSYVKDGINDTSDAIHTIDSFVDKGIAFSVYTIDNEAEMNYYVANRDKLKAITTNYPAKFLPKFR